MTVCQLIYVSRATVHVGRAELGEITAISAANNRKLGVTGALLFCNGYFLQMLEGQPAVLETLYEKICADPRHADAQIIVQFDDAERLFPDWTMSCLHERSMTPAQFEHATAWTRLINLPDLGRNLGRDARELLAEMRSTIAAESTSLARHVA